MFQTSQQRADERLVIQPSLSQAEVEAMQEELSMVTNTYSVTEELPPPSAVHGEMIRKTKFELKRSIKLKKVIKDDPFFQIYSLVDNIHDGQHK